MISPGNLYVDRQKLERVASHSQRNVKWDQGHVQNYLCTAGLIIVNCVRVFQSWNWLGSKIKLKLLNILLHNLEMLSVFFCFDLNSYCDKSSVVFAKFIFKKIYIHYYLIELVFIMIITMCQYYGMNGFKNTNSFVNLSWSWSSIVTAR